MDFLGDSNSCEALLSVRNAEESVLVLGGTGGWKLSGAFTPLEVAESNNLIQFILGEKH